MQDVTTYWHHPSLPGLGMLSARFTRHRYERHTHPTYVIALITEGCERVRVGRQDVVAPAGTLLVVNPEEVHDGEADGESGWAYRTLYPSVPLLASIARELGRDGAPFFTSSAINDPSLARAIGTAHRFAEYGDVLAAETSMLLALRDLILWHGEPDRRAEPPATSGSARRFPIYQQVVESNLGSEIDLRLLAEAAGVTRFQVIRDVRHVLGITPGAFIRDRRVRRACQLIEDGSSIADAALQVGFADQSHLSRSFRATRGMSPGQFQKASHNITARSRRDR